MSNSSKTKQVSLHGRKVYLSPNDLLVARGYATGSEDKPLVNVPGSHDIVALFEDFLGDTGAHDWTFTQGDTGTGNTGVVVSGTNGVFRLTHQNSPLALSTSNLGISHNAIKNWKLNTAKPRDGFLRLTARIKSESVSRSADRVNLFIGFSDSGGAEMPIYDTGGGMISHAADAVGFVFGNAADTGWSLVSAKSTAGDSGDQLVVAGRSYGPTANVYTTLELEMRTGQGDTGGRAHFWIDGKKVGTIDSPVNSATALTPVVRMFGQDTGDQYLDIDYIAVAAPRDTGL